MSETITSVLAAPPLPAVPLRGTVLFPSLFMPLTIGRDGSVAAVEAALAGEEKTLIALAQKDDADEDVTPDGLYAIGTKAVIRKMSRIDESTLQVIVQGVERVRVVDFLQEEPFLQTSYVPVPLPEDAGTEVEALHGAILEQANRAIELTQTEAQIQIPQMLASAGDPLKMAFLLASMMSLDADKEQRLLESDTRLNALRLLHEYMTHELQVLEVRRKIADEAQSEISKEQRDYVLRQQMRAIQEELGEQTPEQAEVQGLRQRLEEADLPDEVRKEAERDLTRLERLPAAAPDHQVTRSYIELILELPWSETTEDNLDLVNARTVLDEDHYGLEQVKDRIIEYLAVMKLNPEAKSPILCLVGPPGVGKTSLGQSVARAVGRKFERMSLGGLHDESELRGHRRTYIGAMPGRVIQALRRAGVKNPLIMLDEVDKLGRDYRGDPSSALLEILDPAQNHTFRDNYLDLAFDLSKVFFVATANTLDTLPGPLLDRLEVIRLAGYAAEEKLRIAETYLLPRGLADVGLSAERVTVPAETLNLLITKYTREAGCRQLNRAIGRLLRKVAVDFAKGAAASVTVTPERAGELLGPEPFRQEEARRELPPGVATGLAYTEAGGEVLYVEASLLRDASDLRLTGQLGDVMRESAQAARSYIWAHAGDLGIKRSALTGHGVHIHVPAGATPKDGPSAGVAMVTALASAYADRPARADTAMTGEVTLSGLVLPIGGIKEKVLAARRAGLKRVVLPEANRQDLRDLPDGVLDEIEFHFVKNVGELLPLTLGG